MVYNRPASIEIADAFYVDRYGSADQARQRLYNVGAGAWSHPCWTNLDLPAQSEAFAEIQAPFVPVNLVLDETMPLDTGTVDAFYSSHVIEHLPEDIAARFIRESYRCLAPGGVFRLTTGPCADLDWAALHRRDKEWWYWFEDAAFVDKIDPALDQMTVFDYWLYSVATPRSVYSGAPCDRKYGADEIEQLVGQYDREPAALLDQMTRGLSFDPQFAGNHLSWWNYSKLAETFTQAGFASVRRCNYGQSALPIMRDLSYFDQTYPQITVYIEATK